MQCILTNYPPHTTSHHPPTHTHTHTTSHHPPTHPHTHHLTPSTHPHTHTHTPPHTIHTHTPPHTTHTHTTHTHTIHAHTPHTHTPAHTHTASPHTPPTHTTHTHTAPANGQVAHVHVASDHRNALCLPRVKGHLVRQCHNWGTLEMAKCTQPLEQVSQLMSHNFSIVDPMSQYLWFSERQMVHLNPNFVGAIICHFSALDHGLLFMVLPNWQTFISQIWTLMTPFERYAFRKL